jgi:ribosomal protein S18 acetylase RimI-like enzyme
MIPYDSNASCLIAQRGIKMLGNLQFPRIVAALAVWLRQAKVGPPQYSYRQRIKQMSIDSLISSNPDPESLRLLEEALIEFNVHATGIASQLFGSFLRDAKNAVVGGISGWTWGKTCFIGYLFVPTELRKQGYGIRLMDAVEAEAIDRRCSQIIVRTHDFQAPHFYVKLGFAAIARIPDYPVGHDEFTMIKHLTKPKALT